MSLINYEKALRMGKEKIKELLVPARVARAKKSAELELCKLEERLVTKESEVEELCCKEELDFNDILTLQDDIAILERRKSQFQSLIEEMFTSEK
ncbi:MAG: hypothetical protein GY941_20130 [Planctomycetes bacterium]|nr:hypothetical protein [Planctomycetota bacterium]